MNVFEQPFDNSPSDTLIYKNIRKFYVKDVKSFNLINQSINLYA